MSAERLALYTTIYPGVEPYLADWIHSVDAQTDRAFDLWVGLDEPCDLTSSIIIPFKESNQCAPSRWWVVKRINHLLTIFKSA